MKYPVIDRKYLPSTLPVFPTLTIWLMLDKIQPPAMIYGVVWTLWGLIFLAVTIRAFSEETTHPSKIPAEKL